MSHWAFLPHIPYPAAKTGYWSPVTSTLNWCEEVCAVYPTVIRYLGAILLTRGQIQDYYATIYSAEIVNALTNLMFVWLGVKGLISCIRNKHDSIFLVAYIGYLVVGIGSFLFHSTLKCKLSGDCCPTCLSREPFVCGDC